MKKLLIILGVALMLVTSGLAQNPVQYKENKPVLQLAMAQDQNYRSPIIMNSNIRATLRKLQSTGIVTKINHSAHTVTYRSDAWGALSQSEKVLVIKLYASYFEKDSEIGIYWCLIWSTTGERLGTYNSYVGVGIKGRDF